MTDEDPVQTVPHPPASHEDWMSAAEREYRMVGTLLESLTDEEWHLPTDCDDWDVRQVVAHLVGAAESTASLRELVRQFRRGRAIRPGVDGMNDLQVRERADTRPSKLIADLAAAGGRGIKQRRGIPAAVRAVRVPFGPPLGVRPIGYLMDRIYTRDAWMHRIDIARVDRSRARPHDRPRRPTGRRHRRRVGARTWPAVRSHARPDRPAGVGSGRGWRAHPDAGRGGLLPCAVGPGRG